MKRKTEKQEISVAEWSFQATYIAVETFLSLEFMNLIENDEKVCGVYKTETGVKKRESSRGSHKKIRFVIIPRHWFFLFFNGIYQNS